jgi:phosphoenolpyruvate---glycerone phosphotransferase subunit DhaM
VSGVALVVVSHSATLAAGVVELAGQMAPDVTLIAVGGTADGGIGTDFDAVSAALERVGHAVLLYDLGSAKMTADLAVESLDDPGRARVVDAPLVEGAVAAAVAAQGGADLDGVAAAAVRGEDTETVDTQPVDTQPVDTETPAAPAQLAATAQADGEDVLLTNEIGLHARPAALLARAVADLDATVTIAFRDKRVDARSVLGVMALGARGGDTVRLSASGPQGAEALARVRALADRQFDE